MNTASILILIVIALALNLAFIALAVQMGTAGTRRLLTELVAMQKTQAQLAVQQQVHDNLKRQDPPPYIPQQR